MTTTENPVSRKGIETSRKGTETRARVIAAAQEVFEELGFHEARVADIAERAGLSHGSFYHYFDSKEAVFHAVATAIDNALAAGMEIVRDRASTATPTERLTAAIRVHFEAYRKQARIMSVIEQVSRHDPRIRALWQQLYQPHNDEFAESIALLQKHGLADPALEPKVAAAALGAMTWRFAEQWLVQGTPDIAFETGLEQITRLFRNALLLSDPEKR